VQEVNSIQEIENLIRNNNFVLLYFSTPDCAVCKVLKPKVEEMIKYFPEIISLYINLDKIEFAKGTYSVFTIPTILLYINGKEYVRESQYISVEELKDKIERYYEIYKLE
jgi:thiol-disulfide isomerase/thioredoxin